MISRRKIDERIKKKEQEIQELELKLREAKAYIQAMNDVVKLFPRGEDGGGNQTELRSGSLMARAREAILKASQPLHITELLETVGKAPSRGNRASLAGSIAAYVRRGEVFTRPKPNTFGLLEMEGDGPEPRQPIAPRSTLTPPPAPKAPLKPSPADPPAPPRDFGIDDDEEEIEF